MGERVSARAHTTHGMVHVMAGGQAERSKARPGGKRLGFQASKVKTWVPPSCLPRLAGSDWLWCLIWFRL